MKHISIKYWNKKRSSAACLTTTTKKHADEHLASASREKQLHPSSLRLKPADTKPSYWLLTRILSKTLNDTFLLQAKGYELVAMETIHVQSASRKMNMAAQRSVDCKIRPTILPTGVRGQKHLPPPSPLTSHLHFSASCPDGALQYHNFTLPLMAIENWCQKACSSSLGHCCSN